MYLYNAFEEKVQRVSKAQEKNHIIGISLRTNRGKELAGMREQVNFAAKTKP